MQHGTVSSFDFEAWIAADPDPAHRIELQRWHESATGPDHLLTPLRFGTAGLRGAMGPGPGRMNRVVVRVTARAIGQELIALGLADRGVVIAHDARPNSDDYALDSARLLRAQGIPCTLVDGAVPTPVLARACLAQGAAAGIMVTASHNPRGDNGYKVYWADGAQIRPPIDHHIESRVDFSTLPSDADLAARHEVTHQSRRSSIADYLGSVITTRAIGGSPRVVYTALCGVGSETIDLAFAAAGLAPPLHVEEQRHPDGSFPGLPFPNPEEPGTLDAAFATAESAGLDIVLANDPDADRLGVAIRQGDGWWKLTGDEIGTLLCDWRISQTAGEQRVIASSVVSGGMVPALCRARGVRHVSTLTGFKWIMRPAIDEPDADWIFGYEEALGFSVTDRVRDKDGISAAVEFVAMLADLEANGSSPRRRLDALMAEVGTYATSQVSVRGDSTTLDDALRELRENPPSQAAGKDIVGVDDWSRRAGDQSTDLLLFELDGGGRIAIRPSGTEPKVKAYLEWRSTTPDPEEARREAETALTAIADDVTSWLT